MCYYMSSNNLSEIYQDLFIKLNLGLKAGQSTFEELMVANSWLKNEISRPCLGHIQRCALTIGVEEVLDKQNLLINKTIDKINSAYQYPVFQTENAKITVNKTTNINKLPRKALHRQELSKINGNMFTQQMDLFSTIDKTENNCFYGMVVYGGKNFQLDFAGFQVPNAYYNEIQQVYNFNELPMVNITENTQFESNIEVKLKQSIKERYKTSI